MIKDDLLKLKTSITAVTATEAGWTTLTRDGTTGQVVIQIDKCPLEGIPIEVIATADTGTAGGGGTHVVTIEASDTLASGYITVATFPTITQVLAKQVAIRMVRRIATQKKYIRSVITRAAAGDSSISRFYQINAILGEMDNDSSY